MGNEVIVHRGPAPPAAVEPARKHKRPTGTTVYTQELAEKICMRIANNEFLDNICQEPDMPAASTVRYWVITNYQGFAAMYDEAHNVRAERLFDEILMIADDTSGDVDYASVYQRKLKIDTRKWLLARIRPSKFGERVLPTRTDGRPLQVRVVKEVRTIKQQRADAE